jgi:hypothetical protein
VLLDATDMLVCGEDLGFVPACLPPVMQVRALHLTVHLSPRFW